ncbi:IS3 family transposase [Paracoccus sp. 08]|uniref:IS3 family transposase n=1 Tax=Paracoccus sp. 08 TaxID=2606624 RepID=UPI0021121ED9|nr:IS3 family transposase [Paracoccus sp. 08]
MSISRSFFYHEPVGETEQNLGLMQFIDKQLLDTPFYGVRQITWHLQNEGHGVNQKRIRRLMRLMRVLRENGPPDRFLTLLTADLPEARHQQAEEGAQDLSLSSSGGLQVDRPGQVWRADITYLPMRRGFIYLVAIMDWSTRKVLAWRISNTLEADFCVEALNEAIHRFVAPGIINTDQGSQFTSFAWTDRLKRAGTRISMDGKGRCIDNVFIERLWRSLKYECVYLHA